MPASVRSAAANDMGTPAKRWTAASTVTSGAVCVAVASAALSMLPGGEAFGMHAVGGGCVASSLNTNGLALRSASRRPAPAAALSMVYTPPSRDTDLQTLEEMKEALNRAVRIPSPVPRESPKTAVPRSPCTSLYGNWRPTTGTENWKSASGKTVVKKKAVKAVDPANKVRAPRGRPPAERKPAVRQDLLPEFVARAAKVLLLNKGQMDSNLFGQQWKMLHRTAPLSSFKNHKGVAVHQMMRENAEYFTVSETNRNKVKMFQVLEDNVNVYLKECGATVSITELDGEAELVKLSNGVEAEDVVSDAEDVLEVEDESAVTVAEDEGPRLDLSMSSDTVNWSEVPMQGKARNSRGYDRRDTERRVKAPARVAVEQFEDAAAAPRAHPEDAFESATVELYNGWAVDGRDVVMEVSNEGPVSEFLDSAVEALLAKKKSFKAVDLGCGNGWAARKIASMAPDATVTAIDAAAGMVERGLSMDSEGVANYIVGDVEEWEPETGNKSLDMVVAVELLHLLEDPKALLERSVKWLKPGGKLVLTLECYKENRLSRSWASDLGIPMSVLAEKKWVDMVENAGFKGVQASRSQPKGPWPGMLVLVGTK